MQKRRMVREEDAPEIEFEKEPEPNQLPFPTVYPREPRSTGVYTASGELIYDCPAPLGFLRFKWHEEFPE